MSIPQSTIDTVPAEGAAGRYGPAMAVVSSIFFMLGFVTVLNDILVPHLKAIFDLNYTQSMLIQFTFFLAYFLISLPAAKVISRVGYHRTIVLGLFVMAAGALLFIPAASAPSYGLFLAGLFVLASGMTLLQVSANPYVAVLGAPERASVRLSLVQALNSVGTTIGPWVGGFLILSAAKRGAPDWSTPTPAHLQARRLLEASSVKLPYLAIAALLTLLAIFIAKFRFPKLAQIEGTDAIPTGSIWRHRHLVLGALGIFAYVGAEVSIGSFLVNYFMQPDLGGFTAQQATHYVSLYWGGAMVGRFAGSAILRKVPTGTLLGIHAIAACALVTISIFTTGSVAMWSILAVGLFNSIMFPSIFTLGIAGLGSLTGKGSGIIIAAIVGGAVIPVAQGALADRIGLHTAFLMPAICYIYILYYGFIGSKPRNPLEA